MTLKILHRIGGFCKFRKRANSVAKCLGKGMNLEKYLLQSNEKINEN